MQGLSNRKDVVSPGNPELNYFDILNLPESEIRPSNEVVETVFSKILKNTVKGHENASAEGNVVAAANFATHIRHLKEAHRFFTQEDPGNLIFKQWLAGRKARNRRRSGSRSLYVSTGLKSKPSASNKRLSIPDRLASDGDVFRGGAKKDGKSKANAKGKTVEFKFPKDRKVFSGDNDVLDSPSERRGLKKFGSQDQYLIPRQQYTGRIDPGVWKELGLSPPPQEIQDAYARYPPLPVDELKFEPLEPDEPALSPPPPRFGNTTNHKLVAGSKLGNTEDDLLREYTTSSQDEQMNRDLRRRLGTWRALVGTGGLTKQQMLQRMKEEEQNAHRQIEFDAQVEAVNEAPRVPWQETARQRALEAQASYREHRDALSGTGSKADVLNRLHRLDFETPGWMKSADPAYWAPGIVGPEYMEDNILEEEENFDWGKVGDWPPPTAEQIKRSNMLRKEAEDHYKAALKIRDLEREKELENLREPTEEEVLAQVKETEPNTWWSPYQRSWFSKLLFGEHESLLDGREIGAAPKRYRFKPSIYKLNDNMELEHVCSPGETYFEHLYFSDETFIWPKDLPKPPGRSARDRWIMKLQETDALREQDGLEKLEGIPGITPTNLPYDPDLFNPPPKSQLHNSTAEQTTMAPRAKVVKPRIKDYLREMQEQKQKETDIIM
ncbi:hypothetical protein TWF718_006892 [Orbilia javanica]|uniref:Uncharacterized protein n=1 Tax=Orbilia javanica TaxID=47235 RepID=A0AAN8MZ53_9PEZI